MADYKKLSESTFNMQAKTYDTDKNGKHARTLYQHVINQLETIKFDNLLDVGCGTGEILTTVKRLYPNTSMYGIDISEEMLKGYNSIFKKLKFYDNEEYNHAINIISKNINNYYTKALKDILDNKQEHDDSDAN